MKKIHNCPTCKVTTSISADNPWRPFCSERCKLIDLGEWMNERHRIPDESIPSAGLPEGEDPLKH